MKVKRILGMALSAVLAFGLAFTAAPVQKAEAATISADTYVHENGEVNKNSENAIAYFGPSGSYTSVSVDASTKTAVLTDLVVSGEYANISLYGDGWTYIFSGTNSCTGSLSADAPVTIGLDDGATVTVDALSVGDVVYNTNNKITLTLADGITVTYQTITVCDATGYNNYSEISTGGSGTLSGTISTESGQYNIYTTVVLASDDSSDDTTPSGGGSSSGSSSSSSSSAAYAAAVVAAMTSSDSAAATAPVAAESAKPDMSANSSIDSAKVKTAANGTAKISNIKSEATEVEIDSTVEVDGVSYKVKTIGKGALKNCDNVKTVTIPSSVTKIEAGAFTGADNLKTVKINTKSAIKVEKGAFKGLDTTKMTVKVSKKMSDKQFSKLQKTLTKAGYKGKLTRSL